jgi:mercuric ion transport protein
MNGTNQAPSEAPVDKSQRVTVAASISSVLSALLASACCIGPLVLALLGIGGAGLLVKFEPYRPYFMAVTFALLGTGFYFTYRKPRTVSAGGVACDCPAPRASRAGKILLWVATAAVAAFLPFPYFAGFLFE